MKVKRNLLYIAAAAVAAAAVLTLVIVKSQKGADNSIVAESGESVSAAGEEKILIPSDSIDSGISFLDYSAADGTKMQFMLVKNNAGEVRGALNTCQVCNGSPYAYFAENGDSVICQNCGNAFPIDIIGEERGGCNPIPLPVTEENENYVVDAAYLDSVSSLFANWKKGIQ